LCRVGSRQAKICTPPSPWLKSATAWLKSAKTIIAAFRLSVRDVLPNVPFLNWLNSFYNFLRLVGVLLPQMQPKDQNSKLPDRARCVINARILLITLGFSILVMPAPQRVKAQEQPAPLVARISLAQGEVAALRGGSKDWVATTANAPVERGGTIATGPVSRTELQLDNANVLRLDQGSEVTVAELARARIQIQVASGLVNFAISKGTEADVEIDTPIMAIHVLSEGVYRIQVISAEYAQLTVCRGRAEVTTSQGSMNLGNGQIIYVKGREIPEYQLAQALGKDDWDRWNDERDRTIAGAQSWQFTNRYYTGSEDLDRYGDWAQVPGYGWCWTPYVEAGWAPYRKGRWVSDPYYEWTWVAYEPWGWAPYHYGRWIFYDGNWCWWPEVGAKGARPVWGPGYVAFLGFGGRAEGSAPGIEFDSFGWCPLGPHDRFNPWWGSGHTFTFTAIANIDNADSAPNGPAEPAYGSNLRGLLTNVHLRGAVTTASAQDFANGRFGHDLYPVNEMLLEQGTLIQGPLPVSPTKASLQLVNRPVNRAALPTTAARGQHFIAGSTGAAPRTSLPAGQTNDSQRPSASVPARTGLTTPATRQDRVGTQQDTTAGADAVRTVPAQPGTSSGWRGFGGGNRITRPPDSLEKPSAEGLTKAEPAPPNAQSRPLTPAPQGNQGGWQHFGSQPAPANRGGGIAGSQSPSGGNRGDSGPSSESPAPRGGVYRL
jgi:hypothetical protein